MPGRIEDQTLIVLGLGENGGPGLEERGGGVDCGGDGLVERLLDPMSIGCVDDAPSCYFVLWPDFRSPLRSPR